MRADAEVEIGEQIYLARRKPEPIVNNRRIYQMFAKRITTYVLKKSNLLIASYRLTLLTRETKTLLISITMILCIVSL